MRYVFLVLFVGSLSFSFAQKKILTKTWKVVEIKAVPLNSDSIELPWIVLDNNKLSGFSACNRMMGEYSLDRKKIKFHTLGSTKMLCMDAANTVERQFFDALEKATRWKIKRKKLYMFDENSTCILKFKSHNSEK
ncbi:MAG: META domain-containing protein [Bacteroidales bacterium]|mgnify:CR=1 FL=1|nr:META domain-containing protein [Bacteroidales bacterium]